MSAEATASTTDAVRGFPRGPAVKKLRAWYRQHQRDLPWRRTRDLYAIWISEIMLQQTQVATVIPYYERFLQQFPDVSSLAGAAEADVLRAWEGLGYYRRARQMHAAAREIVDNHNGEFPNDFDTVHGLPGIGRYTAGAILSFGMDRPFPIVEANTLRLYSRLLMLRDDPRKAAGQRQLWELAEHLLPKRGGGSAEVNQALMELGAEVCTPKSPRCEDCPLVTFCPTHAHQLQDEIPVRPKKIAYQDVVEAAVVVRHADQYLVRQCASDERWAGLWDFLRFEVDSESLGHHNLQHGVAERCGLSVDNFQPLIIIRHGVTRFRITLHVYTTQIDALSTANVPPSLRWQTLAELNDLPLSVTGRKIHQTLTHPPGGQRRE